MTDTAAPSHLWAAAPEVSVHAFVESLEVAAALKTASEDRRLSRVRFQLSLGNIATAESAYASSQSPDLFIFETKSRASEQLDDLDRVVSLCSSQTRIMLVGSASTPDFLKALAERGVCDYLVKPITVSDVIRSVCEAILPPERQLGRIVAVIGAAGGVGASTIAHNLAYELAKSSAQTVLVDLDLGFGTAGLNFNIDPAGGMADLIARPDRISAPLIERVQVKTSGNLSLIAAPGDLARMLEPQKTTLDAICGVLKARAAWTILDVPLEWNGWVWHALTSADQIVVVASPNLANLRNAKNLIDLLMARRLNDPPPLYCLNRVGILKGVEVGASDFAEALKLEPSAIFTFNPRKFETASLAGRLVLDLFADVPEISRGFSRLASQLTSLSAVVEEPFRKKERGWQLMLSRLGKLFSP